MKNTKNFIWGLIFIIIGILIGADVLGFLDFNIFFKGWWTLIIILPCFVGLLTEKDKVGNTTFLIVGIVLLLKEQGILNFDILVKLIVPFSLIAYGFYMLKKAWKNRI